MTDQFQFEPHDDAQDPDEPEPEPGQADRLDDLIDEAYAPVESWSAEPAFAEADTHVVEAPAFEERLEQEQPEIEDDWDEGQADQPEDGAEDGRPSMGPVR